jgi:hypothetical protein
MAGGSGEAEELDELQLPDARLTVPGSVAWSPAPRDVAIGRTPADAEAAAGVMTLYCWGIALGEACCVAGMDVQAAKVTNNKARRDRFRIYASDAHAAPLLTCGNDDADGQPRHGSAYRTPLEEEAGISAGP